MARQYVGKGSNGQIVNIMGGGSTSSSNKGNSSSSSSSDSKLKHETHLSMPTSIFLSPNTSCSDLVNDCGKFRTRFGPEFCFLVYFTLVFRKSLRSKPVVSYGAKCGVTF